jgi:hypothetical protein
MVFGEIEQSMRSQAFCPECKKMVEVEWEEGYDETGETYDAPFCSSCGIPIIRCYECMKFTIDNHFTPLRETDGNCRQKGRIHAMNFICSSFTGSIELKVEKNE